MCILEAAKPLISGVIVLSNDTWQAMFVWIPEKYQTNKDFKGHWNSISRQKMCSRYCGWMVVIHEQCISIHGRWDTSDRGRSWKNRYIGWHEISRSDLREGSVQCCAFLLFVCLFVFFYSTIIRWIRSELAFCLRSAPELFSSLHQLPGCCLLAVHPCLADQRLCYLNGTFPRREHTK